MLGHQLVVLLEVGVDLSADGKFEALANQVFLVAQESGGYWFEQRHLEEHCSQQKEQLVGLVPDVGVDPQDCGLTIGQCSAQKKDVVVEDRQELRLALLVTECRVDQFCQSHEQVQAAIVGIQLLVGLGDVVDQLLHLLKVGNVYRWHMPATLQLL